MDPAPRPLRIAVVVPARDRPDALFRALRSVQRQTRRADEIVVIDDCSTPPIDLPLDDAFLSSIRLIRLDERHGGGGARNIGVAAAQSDLVAFLDSDDMFLPEHLATVEAAALAHPDAAFVSTRILIADNDMNPYQLSGTSRTLIPHLLLLEQGNLIGSCSAIAVMIDRFKAAGGIPPIPSCQDYALLLALTVHADGVNVDRGTVVYRSPFLSHLDSISREFGADLSSRQYIFHHFNFDITPAAVRHRRQVMALLFLLNGRRREAVALLLQDMRPSQSKRLSLRIVIAGLLGNRAYFAILRWKAKGGCQLANLQSKLRPQSPRVISHADSVGRR